VSQRTTCRWAPAIPEALGDAVTEAELSGRAGTLDGLTEQACTLFTPVLPVTDEAFRRAPRLDASALGPNDRLHVGTCLVHDIDTIVSADSGSDGMRGLRRVDPLDRRGLRRLLT
jgi:predicted nucleic acid-binding protein